MKLIKSSSEIIEQEPGLQGIYKQIELAGRTCYKSEDKITPDSAKKFVDAMIKSGHGAMLEHGTVYLKVPNGLFSLLFPSSLVKKYMKNPYSKANLGYEMITTPCSNEDNIISFNAITTNYRVLVENDWLDDLKYLCEPTCYHEKRHTVRFICDRGVSHEIVRHRAMSFAQESQRYCNYSKDKYGNEITFIIPSWLDIEEGHITTDSFGCPVKPVQNTYDFLSGLGNSERQYFRLLHAGHTPQEARGVLSNATKTEVVVTGFASDWKYFFGLRALGTTGTPHPDMQALAEPLYKEFLSLKYIED